MLWGGASIFDKIKENDLIFAFFPCTYFQTYNWINIPCHNYGTRNKSDEEKLEYSRNRFVTMANFFDVLAKLCIVCLRKKTKLVFENPDSNRHILTEFFPLKAKVIHKDRSKYGDSFRKPTQYWFINFEPKNNFIFENIQSTEIKIISKYKNGRQNVVTDQVQRSIITPVYANRFIREYILDE